MKRWMGLDWGQARIGVALSDPLGITAQPFTVLQAAGTQKDVAAVGELVDGEKVTQVIVGLPLNMDGTDSTQTRKVREFARKLSARLGVPVFLVDERLTTRQAEKALLEGNARRKNRRQKVDQVAAALILRSALEGAPLLSPEPA